MANTCKTCKWWSVEWLRERRERIVGYNPYHVGDELLRPEDPDTCAPMVLPFEVRFCNSPKITFFERPVEPDGATVADGSMYNASLITGPEFGCVLWEAV